MKRLIKPILSLAIFCCGMLLLNQETEACKVGQVYREGSRVVFCWGQNGNDCAKCVQAQ